MDPAGGKVAEALGFHPTCAQTSSGRQRSSWTEDSDRQLRVATPGWCRPEALARGIAGSADPPGIPRHNGLPPTVAEVDAFLADKSPNAYEKVVDRLLASPRYGERMAVRWLDAARYADTNGYQFDGERNMWRWRDWVIDSFNRNQPFDQFTIEQIAGDLLPNATHRAEDRDRIQPQSPGKHGRRNHP